MVCGRQQTTDGVWGWVITFASFMINLLVDGVCCTYGVIFPALLDHFGENKAMTQLLNSILIGTLFAFGIGFGMMYLPAIVIVCSHFEKRKSLATGIVVCGTGVGVFVFAPLSEFLLETYSWRGTMWIIAALNLHGVIFAAIYTSPETDSRRNITKVTGFQTLSQQSNDIASESKDICQRLCLPFKSMFDFSLLKSPTMLMYGASCFIIMLAGFACLRSLMMVELLPEYEPHSSFGLVSLSMGLAVFIGPPVSGALSDISGSYNMAFYFGGTSLVLGGLISLPLRRLSEWERRKQKDETVDVDRREKNVNILSTETKSLWRSYVRVTFKPINDSQFVVNLHMPVFIN
ncbi:monocarboxylate transporter 12-like [Pecten maximus]|uniref:monocarboxylate transporter 12-like n=1 Tax=Pecten maximus TaxID=6579 RepID=UPI00145874D2|nr:monocarboxylate transporter 12-like [Pecten maximus]